LTTFVDVNATPNPDDPDIAEPLLARFPHAEATGVAARWGCCCCCIGGPVVVVVVAAASDPHAVRVVAGGTAEVPDVEGDASGVGGPAVVVADACVPHTLRGVAGGTAEVPDDDASGRDTVD
jgi:hypothetical protein